VPGRVSLRLVGQLGGRVGPLAALGSYLYVGVGNQVVVLSLKKPRKPTRVAATDALPGVVEGLAARKGLLVAAAGPEGLLVLDASKPARPRLRGSLAMPGYAEDVALAGKRAFVADGPGGAVAVSGRTAYVADGWDGLRIVDVSKPDAPRELSKVGTTTWVMDVVVAAKTAYLAAGSEGLRTVDVRRPRAPKSLGAVPMPASHADRVLVRKKLAYVSDVFKGVRVIDVAYPRSPSQARLYVPAGSAQDVALDGRYAFVAGQTFGMTTADLSDPAHPTEIASLQTEGPVVSVVGVGRRVFLGTGSAPGTSSTIVSVDVSNPKRPAIRSRQGLVGIPGDPARPGQSREAAVQGTTIYYANEHGLLIVDGSQDQPCWLSFLQTSADSFTKATIGVGVAGHIAYLGASEGGVYVVDVADPREPHLLGSVVPTGLPNARVGAPLPVGTSLFALAQSNLLSFDIQDPVHPRYLAALRLPANWSGDSGHASRPLAYAGGRLLVADSSAGLIVVDISRPDAPRIAGRIVCRERPPRWQRTGSMRTSPRRGAGSRSSAGARQRVRSGPVHLPRVTRRRGSSPAS
jgi:hypothetical protein